MADYLMGDSHGDNLPHIHHVPHFAFWQMFLSKVAFCALKQYLIIIDMVDTYFFFDNRTHNLLYRLKYKNMCTYCWSQKVPMWS